MDGKRVVEDFRDGVIVAQQHHLEDLEMQNAALRAEVERLRRVIASSAANVFQAMAMIDAVRGEGRES